MKLRPYKNRGIPTLQSYPACKLNVYRINLRALASIKVTVTPSSYGASFNLGVLRSRLAYKAPQASKEPSRRSWGGGKQASIQRDDGLDQSLSEGSVGDLQLNILVVWAVSASSQSEVNRVDEEENVVDVGGDAALSAR